MKTQAQNEPSALASPAERATALAESVATTLRLARALATARREIDLAGLDEETGRLCAAVLDLPPTEGRVLRPRLIEVLGELDALEAGLAADRGKAS